jgi:hypothetical protein
MSGMQEVKSPPKKEKGRWKVPTARDINFDIDDYLNRYVPPSQLHRLPKLVARFLGYRATSAKEIGNVLVACWALFGAFCGLLFVGAVFRYTPALQEFNPPVLFASLVSLHSCKK